MCTQGYRECTNGEKRNSLLPNPSETVIHVDPTRGSGDVAGCGDFSNECSTLGYSCKQWINSYHLSVKLYSGEYAEDSISLAFQNIIIEKNISSSRITIHTIPSSSAFCTLAGGSLDISGIQIIHSPVSSSDKCIFSEDNEYSVLVLNECSLKADSTSSSFNKPFFVLTKGEASLESCEISSVLFESTSLFTTEKQARLTLSNVKISMISRRIGDGSMFSKAVQAEESFVLSNVSLENCKCLDGNGGALYLELNAHSTTQIGVDSGCLFDTCTVPTDSRKKRKGGGIYLCLREGAGDFQLKSVQFSGCNSWKGKNVFIESAELLRTANANTIGFHPVIGIGITDFDELSGMENGDQSFIFPLALFLRNFTSPAYVSGQTTDNNYRLCGFSDYPCQSVVGASAARFANTKRNIRFLPSFSFRTETLLNSQSYAFDVEKDNTSINVGSSQAKVSEGLLINSVETSFSKIKFVLEASLNGRSAFILSNANVLSMTDCAAVPAASGASVSYCIVKITNGKLSISNFVVPLAQKLTFDNAPFVAISGSASAELDTLDINGMTTAGSDGLISVDSTGTTTINNSIFHNTNLTSSSFIVGSSGIYSITIKNTTFEEIKRTAGDGSCVFLNTRSDFVSSFTENNCTFNGCSSVEGDGGILNCFLEAEGSLVMNKTSIVSCGVNAVNGKGGGIYLDLKENVNAYLFSGLTFSRNEAFEGKDMFVRSADLNASIIPSLFDFEYFGADGEIKVDMKGRDETHFVSVSADLLYFLVKYSSSTISVGSDGMDFIGCGKAEIPCHSLLKGMQQISGEALAKLILITKSTEVTNTFSLSNFTIRSSSSDGDKDYKSILFFGKKSGEASEPFLRCEGEFSLKLVSLVIASSFNNSASELVLCENGVLSIEKCSFVTEGISDDERKILCKFVTCMKGKLFLTDVSMESVSIAKSAFSIGLIFCEISNFTCTFMNVSDGSIFRFGESGKKENGKIVDEKCIFSINESTITSVTRADNGASVIDCQRERDISIEVSGTTLSDCKAIENQKGGVAFIKLPEEGSFSVLSSTMIRCCCSNEGKGGAFYIDATGSGSLHFLFQSVIFTGNTAKVGNDIYVSCHNISEQIYETQFKFDLREGIYVRQNAIYGIDTTDHTTDTNLMDFITIYQADTIVACSLPESRGRNERKCGTYLLPCLSIDYAIAHITADFDPRLVVKGASLIEDELTLDSLLVASRSKSSGIISISSLATQASEAVITTLNTVAITNLCFVFGHKFSSSHSSFISPGSGVVELTNCSFSSDSALPLFPLLRFSKGNGVLNGCLFSSLSLKSSIVIASSSCSVAITSTRFTSISSAGSVMSCENSKDAVISHTTFTNNTLSSSSTSSSTTLSAASVGSLTLANCSISGLLPLVKRGILAKLSLCNNVMFDLCFFEAVMEDEISSRSNFSQQELCRWNGSLVEMASSTAAMKDSSFANSPEGGLSLLGGSTTIEKGEFANNNPSIEGYPSARRNIMCKDAGSLNMMSLKGGDGVLPNTSMWILNEGCTMGGMAEERESVFFIPLLGSVEKENEGTATKLKIKGQLLLPCNLILRLVFRRGSEEQIEKYDFDTHGFISENEVHSWVPTEKLGNIEDETEVSVSLQYRDPSSPNFSNSFILKNRSEPKANRDERIVERGMNEKSIWPIIVIVLVVILFIILIISIVLAVRWRKAKNEAKDLREIVNDNIRKDPKAFEMVTMETSPEEQWRRAEKEAEKKNEERIKKRVYDSNLEHSESSEHLLSESGSTEYILGRDSDKIPEWALEKEEEEEIRKRTPSPSISSTSITDSDSTFVRGEDLCPTTSSMSNLVDAMACSSPHEKLIVDLRDSLFMLLHGRNETKEMAIGSLKEREQTAAQILFWVANLALHSFDEMENKLQSLSSLSPHIVLFSEHMVICIVMHSDFISSDDSDSSSISSSTVVTAASDDDDDSDSLPSSAFEDEDDYKKECLRWMAPELLMNRKMGATKKSVVFSIGMMLWECLTLEIPFGEYEAEVAGQKIVNGERPNVEVIPKPVLKEIIKGCLTGETAERYSLSVLKREFIQLFPPGTVILTVSDAVDYEEKSDKINSQFSRSTRNGCKENA
ncbi:uncharacterized protein MONOS_1483 [Monocercomonoides exilis]|uniref:uncharacterized protein n=1 Tax=Monocercomonoides exilis TaxID=2049356 RepID=UPI0035595298|nr:hypothetical protein MONOS_1483 [Monocercomonoides exilis]|eukprot:MONOS_1483.1-p1 / transcript=MONOS_1483.1 / gene=MONOS_1483 / organism=Monocercomonoides_exilis_PA203 / gene_product=unspecified product / transcript_product=unspecified product / location=Mono_scaffold00026:125988-132287(-) / protein_length=2099 / sequence_SO=supercontig / SO=protein_coding / is_pseudo=false